MDITKAITKSDEYLPTAPYQEIAPSRILTLSQTTNFRLFQTERVCR